MHKDDDDLPDWFVREPWDTSEVVKFDNGKVCTREKLYYAPLHITLEELSRPLDLPPRVLADIEARKQAILNDPRRMAKIRREVRMALRGNAPEEKDDTPVQ